MSQQPQTQGTHDIDPIERLAHTVPLVIPVVGGLMIFLLAFIAIFVG